MKISQQGDAKPLLLKPINQLLDNTITPVLHEPSRLNTGDTVKLSSIFSQNGSLPSPAVLFVNTTGKTNPINEPQPKGHNVSDGVWYSNTMKTADGGIIHLLTVDTKKVNVNVEFSEKGKSIAPSNFKGDNNFIAAINGQFYGDVGAIGDMKSGNKIYQDEKVSSSYDHFSDKRYFMGRYYAHLRTAHGERGGANSIGANSHQTQRTFT